jgi:hypothetical protein
MIRDPEPYETAVGILDRSGWHLPDAPYRRTSHHGERDDGFLGGGEWSRHKYSLFKFDQLKPLSEDGWHKEIIGPFREKLCGHGSVL